MPSWRIAPVHAFKLAGWRGIPCLCASMRCKNGHAVAFPQLQLKCQPAPCANVHELLPTAVPPISSQVGGAVLSGCVVEGCNRANGMAQELRLWRIERMPSLQQLVAAALPAGMQPSQLRSLDFVHCVLSLPAVLSCPFVGHLTSLSLSHCSAQDGNETQVYEALLQQAPRLLSLSLSGFWPSPIPAAIVSRTGLSRLCLASDGMAELPPGPYLSSECVTAAPVQLRFVCTACQGLRSPHVRCCLQEGSSAS